MNVTCPGCATVYRVDPAKVPAQGIRARCQVCSAVFAVRRGAEAEAAVRTPAIEPATLVRPVVTRPAPPPPPAPEPPPPAPPPVLDYPPAPPPRAPEPPTEPSIRIPALDDVAPAPPPRATEPRLTSPVASAPTAAPVAPVRPPAQVLRLTVPPPHPFPPAGAPPRPTAPAGAAPPASPPRIANPFLNQDPNQKARRLARALISDLAVYFPDRRKKALAGGTLKAEFEEEIRKSWEEYTEQVGKAMAESTTHFNDALNEILASGQKIF